MTSLDDMDISDAIKLYYEKHYAIRQADMEKLRELKTRYPDLFDKEKEACIREIIEYAKEFEKTAYYRRLLRLKMKDKLTLL